MDTVKEFWYINIVERPERKARLEARTQKIGLKLQRFEAVTPRNDKRVDALRKGRAQGQIPGAIGCTLSHYDLWRRAAETNQRIYIQEDDLIYRKDFVSLVDDFIRKLDKEHPDWDVLHLNAFLGHEILDSSYHNKLIPLTGMTWSLGSYVINPSAARLCLSYYDFPAPGAEDPSPAGPGLQIPDILISWLFTTSPGKSFTTYPYPSIQDKLGTDVQTSHQGLKNDHEYYYNQYGRAFKNVYDWTETDVDFDKPLRSYFEKQKAAQSSDGTVG
jgi:GR25 family glycosyltransferase involved in LPS biosynthesis